MRLPTLLLQRKLNSYKGDFGHVFILAGSYRYSGAAALCSESAMRSGSGLVTLGIPEGLTKSIIKIKPKEVMLLPLPQTNNGTLALSGYKAIQDFTRKTDVIAIGPGLGNNTQTYKLVRKIINNIGKNFVIDADGINALTGHLDIIKKKAIDPKLVLTPHLAEMARLLNVRVIDVEKNRKKIAQSFVRKYNIVLCLKGNKTIVSSKNRLYLNNTGNPGMATAGSGDVLTGIIAAFIGHGLPVFESAKYGVYLHGLAGDLAASEKGQVSLIASDIIAKIPEAIKKCS